MERIFKKIVNIGFGYGIHVSWFFRGDRWLRDSCMAISCMNNGNNCIENMERMKKGRRKKIFFCKSWCCIHSRAHVKKMIWMDEERKARWTEIVGSVDFPIPVEIPGKCSATISIHTLT